jgi:quaternary ammonium compound-resistance protein SugE
MSWIYLLMGRVFEVDFITFLKLWPTIGLLFFSRASFLFFAEAIHTTPLGTAYALWTRIGAFRTAVVGIYFFNGPLSFLRGC